MCVGWLEVKKYESVGHEERFGTPFAHVINLKVPIVPEILPYVHLFALLS